MLRKIKINYYVRGVVMFTEKMEKKYHTMSIGQRKIADFIKDNLADTVYMNAKEISDKVGISESGVVRFATFLGYKGFKEMQKGMQEEFKIKQSIFDRFEEALNLEDENMTDTMRVYNLTLKNLNDTVRNIPDETYEKAIEMINSARRIGVIGTRVAVAPALTLQVLLNQLVEDVELLTPNFDTSFDTLQTWGEEDLLIGFSFMKAKNFSYDMLSFGKEKGCKIISICDNYRNSIADLGDIVFPVSSESAFVSFVPTMLVIDTLLFKISREAGSDKKARLKEFDSIIKRFVRHN
ncbi:MAG: RpiR family transcriptional regulator [Fusobacteria bacterium]|nr:MAG: RpiR family transcriptional regulator [Fusobacteriota bacterium]KAF0228627.1 MAG: RpiR family transcriptional [Fusobacteriota bacterium]